MTMSVHHLCNACGSTAYRAMARLESERDGKQYTALSCQRCGLWCVSPMPVLTHADLQHVYDNVYTDGQRAISDQADGLLRLANHRQMEIVEHYVAPGRALNIGAMSGAVRVLVDRGWELQIVEVSDYAAESARRRWNLPVTVSRIEDFECPPATYDLIKLGHVIEHVTDPKRVLHRLAALLKPQGVLLIETDNSQGLKTQLEVGVRRLLGDDRAAALVRLAIRKNLRKRYGRLTPPEHLYVFNESSMRHALADTGLTIQKVFKPAWGDPTWFPLADLAQFSATERLFIRLDQLGARAGFGDVIVVLAQKA